MTSADSDDSAVTPVPSPLTRRRIWLFRGIALLIPVLFFMLLEGGLRLFNYGEDLDLFIPAPPGFADKEYLMVNPDVAKRYFTKGAYTPVPPYEFFTKHKPANGYRIFVMGGSTTAAWPYPNNVLFSRILGQRLADAFPDKYIEVVNVAIAAVNSYTLLDFMDEVLAQQPDAILIYAGHNEFYGALGVASTESLGKFRPLVTLYLSLQKLKTVALLETGIAKARRWYGHLMHGKATVDAYATLMGRMINKTDIPYRGSDYQYAERQFQTNLEQLFGKAKKAGVPVVISEVVSNLRDQAPFVSQDSQTDSSADTAYREAQKLEAEGKYDQARTAYYRAKDLDALRFRAPEDFNRLIHHVADEFKAPVVPMKSYFEAASPHGLIGANLMLEHLHPKVEGQFIMSEAFFDVLHRQGMIARRWNDAQLKPAAYYREFWPITEFDRTVGRLRVLHLTDHWPFHPPDKPGHAFENFQPGDKVEEIAYRTEKNEMSFIQGHLAAAAYYASQGQERAAQREYQAMAASAPSDYKTLLIIAGELIKSKQFDQAMTYLTASLRLKDTAYANKWLGQLELYFQKPQQALSFLEKAAAWQSDDAQVLYNLSGAYLMTGQLDKAREAMTRLEKTKADFPGIEQLKEEIEQRQGGAP